MSNLPQVFESVGQTTWRNGIGGRPIRRVESTVPLDAHHLSIAATEAANLPKFLDSRGIPLPSMANKILPSATVVIVRRVPHMEVLIHRRADNAHWGLIGGVQEIGESILQCVAREAKEETGYDIWISPCNPLACVDSDPEQYATCVYPDGNVIQFCNLTFLAVVIGGDMRLSQESKELRWVRPDDLPEPFLPAHIWRLKNALGLGEWPHVAVR